MLSVYPNPSKDDITIKWTNEAEELLIYNQTGSLIKKIKPNNLESKVKLNGLEPGFYIINTTIEGEKFDIKFIII